MAREKKQRIATDAAKELRTNPFASLEIQGRQSTTGGTGVCLGAISIPPRRDSGSPVTTPSPTLPRERLLLRRSTAHRAGKTVLILEGFSSAWNTAKLEDLLRELKASLGCGGQVNGRTLEIQGDQPERLTPLLEARGFAVKRGW